MKYLLLRTFVITLTVFSISLMLFSCQSNSSDNVSKNQGGRLVGTWLMTARIVDETETPAVERVMKLALNSDATFVAYYRGEPDQDWIVAGQGAFSYEPPMLNLYWETGRVINLLVDETQPDKLVLHHGRNIAPLKDQEPDEVFVRHKGEKGPTR